MLKRLKPEFGNEISFYGNITIAFWVIAIIAISIVDILK